MLSNRLLSILLLSVFAIDQCRCVSDCTRRGQGLNTWALNQRIRLVLSRRLESLITTLRSFRLLNFQMAMNCRQNVASIFTIDKLYSSISGDGAPVGGVGNNYIWGTRYEGGYMNTEDDGWHVVFENSEGNEFLNGADILNANPTLYEARFATLEVNKIFRQRLNRGGWIEPYIGLRYYGHTDDTLEDIGAGLVAAVTGNRFTQRVTNNAIGMNIGGRLVKRRGRFRMSHDLALTPMYSQQRFRAIDITNNLGTIIVNEIGESGNSFVPALDYRFEIAYNLTRDFGFRGGASINYLWDGIARANTASTLNNPNSILGAGAGGPAGLFEDDLVVGGFSFGIEYRR